LPKYRAPSANSTNARATPPICPGAASHRARSRRRTGLMTNLDVSDIQGFAVRGYNFPYARYLLLELGEPAAARVWLNELLKIVTTAERWDVKPMTTVNIAFTHPGLIRLDLPLATLLSFPLEFQQGMKGRGPILGDNSANAPDRWDPVWRESRVHAWLAINAREAGALDDRSD